MDAVLRSQRFLLSDFREILDKTVGQTPDSPVTKISLAASGPGRRSRDNSSAEGKHELSAQTLKALCANYVMLIKV